MECRCSGQLHASCGLAGAQTAVESGWFRQANPVLRGLEGHPPTPPPHLTLTPTPPPLAEKSLRNTTLGLRTGWQKLGTEACAESRQFQHRAGVGKSKPWCSEGFSQPQRGAGAGGCLRPKTNLRGPCPQNAETRLQVFKVPSVLQRPGAPSSPRLGARAGAG